ncbi:hypothetical protein DL765_009964 [Monosporascus sp. GIB2]|nr:hypothetical protein DL765_009964 [Monosporascus sp. GIB2]
MHQRRQDPLAFVANPSPRGFARGGLDRGSPPVGAISGQLPCIQSNSACPYYNSYSTSGSFPSEQDGRVKPPYLGPTSAAAQTVYAFRPGPQLPASATANYYYAFPNPTDVSGEPPTTTISVDTGAPNCRFGSSRCHATNKVIVPRISQGTLPKVQVIRAGSLDDAFQKGEKYEEQGLFADISSAIFHSDGHPVLQKRKRLARRLKAKSDRLVQLYLQTFESVFRVLHVPTFKRDYVQYWSNPQATSERLEIQLLLVVAIAMATGLHFGPSQLPVSTFEAEIRRRLWATVLELAVQTSLDSGVHPVISGETLDSCELPSNLDDSQISESTKTMPAPQPTTTLTQNSIQYALMRSLPIQFKIAGTLSRFRAESPYNSTQRMGAGLTVYLRETSDLIDLFDPTPPSAFQIQLQEPLGTYYFSRAVCLECSLPLLSPSHNNSSSNGPRRDRGRDSNNAHSSHDDYTNLRVYGDGLFRNVFLAAAIDVYAQFLLQLCEVSAPAAVSLSRRELLQAIEDAVALTHRRILKDETSVKTHVFLACVLAKTGASKRCRPSSQNKMQTDQAVEEAGRRALDACCDVLEARMSRIAVPKNSEVSISVSSTPISDFPIRLPAMMERTMGSGEGGGGPVTGVRR